MAHRKAGGSAKNLRDSKPKYLGIKLYAGEKADFDDSEDRLSSPFRREHAF